MGTKNIRHRAEDGYSPSEAVKETYLPSLDNIASETAGPSRCKNMGTETDVRSTPPTSPASGSPSSTSPTSTTTFEDDSDEPSPTEQVHPISLDSLDTDFDEKVVDICDLLHAYTYDHVQSFSRHAIHRMQTYHNTLQDEFHRRISSQKAQFELRLEERLAEEAHVRRDLEAQVAAEKEQTASLVVSREQEREELVESRALVKGLEMLRRLERSERERRKSDYAETREELRRCRRSRFWYRAFFLIIFCVTLVAVLCDRGCLQDEVIVIDADISGFRIYSEGSPVEFTNMITKRRDSANKGRVLCKRKEVACDEAFERLPTESRPFFSINHPYEHHTRTRYRHNVSLEIEVSSILTHIDVPFGTDTNAEFTMDTKDAYQHSATIEVVEETSLRPHDSLPFESAELSKSTMDATDADQHTTPLAVPDPEDLGQSPASPPSAPGSLTVEQTSLPSSLHTSPEDVDGVVDRVHKHISDRIDETQRHVLAIIQQDRRALKDEFRQKLAAQKAQFEVALEERIAEGARVQRGLEEQVAAERKKTAEAISAQEEVQKVLAERCSQVEQLKKEFRLKQSTTDTRIRAFIVICTKLKEDLSFYLALSWILSLFLCAGILLYKHSKCEVEAPSGRAYRTDTNADRTMAGHQRVEGGDIEAVQEARLPPRDDTLLETAKQNQGEETKSQYSTPPTISSPLEPRQSPTLQPAKGSSIAKQGLSLPSDPVDASFLKLLDMCSDLGLYTSKRLHEIGDSAEEMISECRRTLDQENRQELESQKERFDLMLECRERSLQSQIAMERKNAAAATSSQREARVQLSRCRVQLEEVKEQNRLIPKRLIGFGETSRRR
ncbi:hypothetical protein EVG20_g6446 [Dentipellis fragilis]|uniref:Uncharacterized protein n=1 Tax=Dentipellis fragilis TaxID=205917 RepID=A0A4Y9YQ02_9AGAM|nr:hypothetical protein EVG20_g6446 [Dentipellis fragilis]